jgi:hypothetical protein
MDQIEHKSNCHRSRSLWAEKCHSHGGGLKHLAQSLHQQFLWFQCQCGSFHGKILIISTVVDEMPLALCALSDTCSHFNSG